MMLSIEERYEIFKNTIEECGTDILLENEDMIEYKLFEEFAVDAVSFLHEDMLDVLLEEELKNLKLHGIHEANIIGRIKETYQLD